MLITLWACAAGCALFDTGGWRSPNAGKNDQQLLKPIDAMAPHAVRLKYQIIARPIDEPMMGDLLWDELVEIGLFDDATRRVLNECGVRVGVASNPPPTALEKLQDQRGEYIEADLPEAARRQSRQVITLPEGGEVDALAGGMRRSCRAKIPDGTNSKIREFEQARGIFVISAQSDQDGWARVRFAPEIRHGDVHTHPVAGANGWKQWETGQSTRELPQQRFDVLLNEGDSVVITAMGPPGHRIGDLFFRDEVDGVEVQRMLVVTLVETSIEAERGVD